MDAAQLAAIGLGKVADDAIKGAGNADDAARLVDASKTAKGASQVFDGIGKASGFLDAGVAIHDAFKHLKIQAVQEFKELVLLAKQHSKLQYFLFEPIQP